MEGIVLGGASVKATGPACSAMRALLVEGAKLSPLPGCLALGLLQSEEWQKGQAQARERLGGLRA